MIHQLLTVFPAGRWTSSMEKGFVIIYTLIRLRLDLEIVKSGLSKNAAALHTSVKRVGLATNMYQSDVTSRLKCYWLFVSQSKRLCVTLKQTISLSSIRTWPRITSARCVKRYVRRLQVTPNAGVS